MERKNPPSYRTYSPWTAEETDACFIVKGNNEPGRRTPGDEARRIAANIAKLPHK